MGSSESTPDVPVTNTLSEAKSLCLHHFRHNRLCMVGVSAIPETNIPTIRVFVLGGESSSFLPAPHDPEKFIQEVINHLLPHMCNIEYHVIHNASGKPICLIILKRLRTVRIDIEPNGAASFDLVFESLSLRCYLGEGLQDNVAIERAMSIIQALRAARLVNFGKPTF